MEYYASLGIRADEGWDAIAARLRRIVDRFPQQQASWEQVRWENLNVNIAENMAWVTYDQIGLDGAEDLKRELKILQRVDGAWKIACVVMLEGAVEQASVPLIEVDVDMRIVWTNRLAHELLRSHEGLINAGGRLRARHRSQTRRSGKRSSKLIASCRARHDWHCRRNNPGGYPSARIRRVPAVGL
jgi:PAS domain-containing protein